MLQCIERKFDYTRWRCVVSARCPAAHPAAWPTRRQFVAARLVVTSKISNGPGQALDGYLAEVAGQDRKTGKAIPRSTGRGTCCRPSVAGVVLDLVPDLHGPARPVEGVHSWLLSLQPGTLGVWASVSVTSRVARGGRRS